MQATIHLLTEHTINKIAAGEVIENPASVIKELVENSIDAGSTTLIVEIKGGGLGLIRVSDNGKGMSSEDAKLCLQRHATSKIQDVEDLFHIQTMGFRGEALASVAAISKLTLTTSQGGREGTKIEIAAGEVKHTGPASRAQGTTLEVRTLFYNVPARLKFQKSPGRCTADITKTLTELSLAHPFISFELINEGKRVLFVTSEQDIEDYLLHRSKAVLGDAFSSSSFPVNFEEGGITLKGILGAPSNSRANRLGQHIFINARCVSCPSLSFAVKEGYGTRIEQGRFPAFVLHLTLPPNLLDVNVHPQKKEVRIKDESLLKTKVMRAISSSLNRLSPSPTASPPSFSFSSQGSSFPKQRDSFAFRETFTPSTKGLRFREEPEEWKAQKNFDLPPTPIQPIGLFKTYLLLEGANVKEHLPAVKEDALILVDLLATRARLLFDTLEQTDKKIESQALMFPLTLSFTSIEMAQIIPDLPLLRQCGFDLRPIGDTALLIEAHPPFLSEDKLKDIILDLTTIQQKERKRAALASRLARFGTKHFTQIEAVRLFQDLLKSPAPNHCPLGKATFSALSPQDIEKLLLR